jgi:phage gp45-like
MARQDYQNLQSTPFHGVILPGVDYKNQGRYKVHIPQLMPNIQDDGIFVYNKIHNQLNTTYGEYKPLQAGTEVLISFKNGDYKNGEIIKIVENTAIAIQKREAPIPVPNVVPEDRDKITVLSRTNENHLVCLVDSTLPEDKGGTLPGQSIHIYHGNGRERIVINSSGIHIVCDNFNLTATNMVNINCPQINIGNSKVNIHGSEINIGGGTINLKGTTNAETVNARTVASSTVKGNTVTSPSFKGPLPTGGGQGASAPSVSSPNQAAAAAPALVSLKKKSKNE